MSTLPPLNAHSVPNLILDTQTLEKACTELVTMAKTSEVHPYVGFDTEFIRKKTYWPEASLVQIGHGERVFLIDIMAFQGSLDPLFELYQNPDITLVIHSARQDIELMYHLGQKKGDTHLFPKNIFDTQLGSLALGLPENTSFEKLTKHFLNISLNKKCQKSPWGQRPLSDNQLSYAYDDVFYLNKIFEKMYATLVKKNRLHWLDEENQRLVDPKAFEPIPEKIYEKLALKASDDTLQKLLMTMALWREVYAREINKTKNLIIKDQNLFYLAKKYLKSQGNIETQEGFSKETLQHFHDFMKQERSFKTSDPVGVPKKTLTILKWLREKKSQHHLVCESLLASTKDLQDFVKDPHKSILMQGWRKEIFGDDALEVLQGNKGLWIKKGDIAFV